MSSVEMALEKVKLLDELHAQRLLAWLQDQDRAAVKARTPAGAMAMLGFARRFHPQPRPTADWLEELRAGERE